MATADLSWLEFAPGLTAQVSWLEFSTPPPSATAAVSWLQFEPPAGTATASVSWLEFGAPAAPAIYTLTAEAGAYTMTWAGSTGQMVLVAEAGAYLMAEQPATLTVIFDVTTPTINTGDNLRFLKDRNRRPVLFPD